MNQAKEIGRWSAVAALAIVAALGSAGATGRCRSDAARRSLGRDRRRQRIEIPFRFEIAGAGAAIKGSFFNGDEKVTSTSGTLENGVLTLNFDEYGSKVDRHLKDGVLEGEYNRGTRRAVSVPRETFRARSRRRHEHPSITGLWNIAGEELER